MRWIGLPHSSGGGENDDASRDAARKGPGQAGSGLPPDPGEVARRLHSAWLTAALASGRRFPRIPLRRVDAGGFDWLMSRPEGPQRAERWWKRALRRVRTDGT
ncbi:MAG: hypothetical protein SFZ23_12815 [Planctomycetota bacterium]|nr:hypothetical protein [Planctomycetota bacterium]